MCYNMGMTNHPTHRIQGCGHTRTTQAVRRYTVLLHLRDAGLLSEFDFNRLVEVEGLVAPCGC